MRQILLLVMVFSMVGSGENFIHCSPSPLIMTNRPIDPFEMHAGGANKQQLCTRNASKPCLLPPSCVEGRGLQIEIFNTESNSNINLILIEQFSNCKTIIVNVALDQFGNEFQNSPRISHFISNKYSQASIRDKTFHNYFNQGTLVYSRNQNTQTIFQLQEEIQQ